MSNQYEVLGKAPSPEDLKKLSPSEIHLTIKGLNAGYGKMEILHNFDLFVNKAQSLCLIGPNGAGKSTILHSIYGFTNIFSGQIEIDGKEITNLTPAEKLSAKRFLLIPVLAYLIIEIFNQNFSFIVLFLIGYVIYKKYERGNIVNK